ncbi:MAG: hypothetical protein J6A38_03530 [Clostridia bacterium]|nr:hypothetical protein [Clostridia bacterium]
MKTYESIGEKTIRRIGKEQRKARNVGWFYFLGIIALATLAFFPFLEIGGEKWSAIDYFKQYKNFVKALPKLSKLLLVYVFLSLFLIAILCNALKGLCGLGTLNKRSMARKDRNRDAMEKMGKIFSGSFACYVIFYFLHFLFFGWKDDAIVKVELTTFGYLTLAVGVGVHFFGGLIGGNVRRFQNNKTEDEAKRPYGIFLYFLANVLQYVAVAGILYFFLQVSIVYLYVFSVISQDSFLVCSAKEWIYLGLQGATLLSALVLVKHATANTEYNFFGRDGSGMKNFRVFSILTALFAIGCFGYYWYETADAGKANYPYEFLIVAGIAIASFICECIFKANWNKEEMETSECDASMQPLAQPPVQQAPQAYPPAPIVNVQAPYPVPYYLPTPNVGAVEDSVAEDEKEPETVSEWQILCPTCKKRLQVKDSKKYHCCPACNGVFTLRKHKRKMVKPGVSQSNRVQKEEQPLCLVDFNQDPFAK